MASELGANVDSFTHEQLFGEDQARYVITAKAADAAKIVATGQAIEIGKVLAKADVNFGDVSITVAELKSAHEGWFPKYMA